MKYARRRPRLFSPRNIPSLVRRHVGGLLPDRSPFRPSPQLGPTRAKEDGSGANGVLGSRHRTGRIARFTAQTGNIGDRLPVPIDLVPPDLVQPVDFLWAGVGPNRPNFIWDNRPCAERRLNSFDDSTRYSASVLFCPFYVVTPVRAQARAFSRQFRPCGCQRLGVKIPMIL